MFKFAKPVLMIVLVLEIISIFVMLRIYDNFVSNPANYTSLAIIQRKASKAKDLGLDKKDIAGAFLPAKFLIKDVPFATQSPDKKWDEIGEESCEEASMIIVDYFLKKKQLNDATMFQERNKLVEYEITNYGDFRDENAKQISQRLKDYFGYRKVEIIYDFTLEELKEKLIEGRPIIIPAAGRLLKNPNFKQPGPLYHNLVVIGYEGTSIITNDPGTIKGKGYRYNENVLYGAIHDFPGSKELIEQGRKAMIIVED